MSLARRHAALGLRLCVGPLALAGFFLPWAHGPGVLAGIEFTGFRLVGFAGRLEQLDLGFAEGGLLRIVRMAILGVAVAGAWQTLLAPAHRWHRGYGISGWYLVAVAGAALAIGAWRAGGLAVPPAGLALLGAAGVAWLAARGLGGDDQADETSVVERAPATHGHGSGPTG